MEQSLIINDENHFLILLRSGFLLLKLEFEHFPNHH